MHDAVFLVLIQCTVPVLFANADEDVYLHLKNLF